jgi:hypothetical protein
VAIDEEKRRRREITKEGKPGRERKGMNVT